MNREQLLSSLQQGVQTLLSLPDPGRDLGAVLRRLRGAAAILAQPRLRVGVFGITSSGKSALLNAFLGEQLLPEQSPPSSNVPVLLRAGPRRSLTVRRQAPGAQPEQVPPTAESLEALGTIDGNPENRKSIRLLELELPQTLIPSGVELEDSPGLGASAAAGRAAETQVRLESLPRADILLYLLAAGRFSRIDKEMLREFHPDQPVICVISAADRFPAEQLDATEQLVREHLPGAPVIRMNAKLAQNHAAPDWQSSGFPDLLAALDDATRKLWDSRIQAALKILTEVGQTLRSVLGERLAKARAEYDTEKSRHDQILQAQARLLEARTDLEHEISRLSQFTPIDHVLQPVAEWLDRLQVVHSAVEPALRILQKRLDEAPDTYRTHVNQTMIALAGKHPDLSSLRTAVIKFPAVPPQPALSWPLVTMETRAAFGLLKQKTVMVQMQELQHAVETAVQAAVAPLREQAALQLRAWAERVLDARLASWNTALPEAAARLAAAARPIEQLAEVNRYWQPLGSQTERVAAASEVITARPQAETKALAALVTEFRELALPRLLLRAIHDVSGTGQSGRRRVLLTGNDFPRQWQLAQLLLRERQSTGAPPRPASGLLWLQTPARHTPPPFPCDACPHPEHRLLDRIELVVAADGAEPGALAAAVQWADAVIVAAPVSNTDAAMAAASQARLLPKAILVLDEAGAQADRLPELAATLAAWRGAAVILHDGHDVRYTHFLSLIGRSETPASLVRLWRARRLRQGPPFDPADLQGYFAQTQAGRNGVNA